MARMVESERVMTMIVVTKFITFPWILTKTGRLEVAYTGFSTRKIMSLISRWRCIRIIIRRLRNVSIMQLLQIQSGVQM